MGYNVSRLTGKIAGGLAAALMAAALGATPGQADDAKLTYFTGPATNCRTSTRASSPPIRTASKPRPSATTTTPSPR